MPELPEVEVTKEGLLPLLLNRTIQKVNTYNPNLRFKIPQTLKNLESYKIIKITRRAKYIIVETNGGGSFVIHLGMTGHLKVVPLEHELVKHDHWEMILDNGTILRYNDPRRFGALLWTDQDPLKLEVFVKLGSEPLQDQFDADYLYEKLKARKTQIKLALTNNEIVVGVGNIYASEILYSCHISPMRASNQITKQECQNLVQQIKLTLTESIKQGGTTIRDFAQVDGKPGYFVQNLLVYGRDGEPCKVCQNKIQRIVQGQRSTYFCPYCQK